MHSPTAPLLFVAARLPSLMCSHSLQSHPIPHTTVFADGASPPACNFPPAAVVLICSLSLQSEQIPHTTVFADGAPPCMQLCVCRCFFHWLSPFNHNQYLTLPYLQTVRRPLLATLRLPLLFSCSSFNHNQYLTPPYWQTVRRLLHAILRLPLQ